MPPLVSLEKVDVALDGELVLHDISWQLMPQEHWSILGGNGSGKSTLLKVIRGELWPAPGRGRRVYALDGQEQSTAVGVKERIAIVSPELQSRYLQQEWKLTALEAIHSGFQGGDYAYQKPGPAQKRTALEMAHHVGALHLLGRNVQELSTGELRKVLIARALVGKPRVLICDEICDGLDADSRAALLGTLQKIASQGTQIVCATHRAEELIPAITHRLVLRHGRVIEQGRISLIKAGRGGSHGESRTKQSTESCDSDRLAAKVQVQRGDRRPIIEIKQASVFLNNKRVLRKIDWSIAAGEHWAVVGSNGAGKTTLLKLVLGEVHPAWGGRVQRFEFTPRNTLWQIKRRIGHVSPELQSNYHEEWTGEEVIGSGFFASIGLMRRLSRAQTKRISELTDLLQLGALARKSILKMSYGEFRKILLARALVHRPVLLICDEPLDGLDARTRDEIASTFQLLAGSGTTLLVVTHHRDDLPDCITHVAELNAGVMTFQGSVEAFRNSPKVTAAINRSAGA